MLIVKMILALVVFLVLLFFTNINMKNAQLFYTREQFVEIPLFLIILASLLIGMVVALCISFVEKWKMRGKLRQCKKEMKRIEGELNSLRKMPILNRPEEKVSTPRASDTAKESS